jgi:quercetin dioxygenase-like cupin family protein
MTTIARLTLLFVVAMVAGAAAQQGKAEQGKTVTPAEMKWPASTTGGVGTSGASGIQTVVLTGDPSKPGLYTIRLKAAPGMKIQAHSHSDDRAATVVSGTWYFAYGRQFDEKALKALPPGSFYTEPGGVDHFAMTKEEVVIQITGYGPSATTYVDAANDPARR